MNISILCSSPNRAILQANKTPYEVKLGRVWEMKISYKIPLLIIYSNAPTPGSNQYFSLVGFDDIINVILGEGSIVPINMMDGLKIILVGVEDTYSSVCAQPDIIISVLKNGNDAVGVPQAITQLFIGRDVIKIIFFSFILQQSGIIFRLP